VDFPSAGSLDSEHIDKGPFLSEPYRRSLSLYFSKKMSTKNNFTSALFYGLIKKWKQKAKN